MCVEEVLLLLYLVAWLTGCGSPCMEGYLLVGDNTCVRQGGKDTNTKKDDGPDTATDTQPDTGPDTQEPPLGTWTLGAVEACDVPQAAPSYTDASTSIGTPAVQLPSYWGHVMLLEIGGELVVGYSRGFEGLVLVRLSDGSQVAEYLFSRDAGVAAAKDMDGDGLTDMVLYGEGLEVAWSAGTEVEERTTYLAHDNQFPGHDVTVADFDGDGHQDILVIFKGAFQLGSAENHRPVLLRGQGGREFVEVGLSADSTLWGVGFDSSHIDIDGDGDLDVYLCHDSGPQLNGNLLLENDGAGNLEAASDQRGLDVVTFCMGTSWGDVNNDGLLDAYLSTMDEHYLLLRDAGGAFYEASTAAQFPNYLEGFGANQMGWGSSLVDVDNDGLVDLLLGTSDFAEGNPTPYPLWLLQQRADGTFSEVSDSFGLPQLSGSRGVITQDVNQDGLVDFLVGDMFRSPYLFLSEGCTASNWLEIVAPDGTQVLVEAGGVRRSALITIDPGFGASGPPRAHFGLGETASIERITLTVPGEGVVVMEGPMEARRRLAWEKSAP